MANFDDLVLIAVFSLVGQIFRWRWITLCLAIWMHYHIDKSKLSDRDVNNDDFFVRDVMRSFFRYR